MADTHYLAVAPHVAAVPNFLAFEWHGMSVPYWEDVLESFDSLSIQDGDVEVPEAPDLGVELSEDVAPEYVLEASPSSKGRECDGWWGAHNESRSGWRASDWYVPCGKPPPH
jgi:hypothetical protein